jgi:lauroyl/myristoyl acyltransferase
MGNYDLAAPVFAGRFGRRLNAVRAPEREVELQAHYEKRRAESESEAFAVRYNADGAMLGVELAKLLGDGELVALQGDRVLFEVAPVEGEMFGRKARLPKGPFALAMASGAEVWPLFILRDGWRRYRIRVGQSFAVKGERGAREEAMQRGVTRWCEELEAVVARWWYQWFVLEEVFGETAGERREIPAAGESEPAVRGAQRGRPRITFSLAGLAAGASLVLSARWLWGSPAVIATPLVAFAGVQVVGLVQAGAAAVARRFGS